MRDDIEGSSDDLRRNVYRIQRAAEQLRLELLHLWLGQGCTAMRHAARAVGETVTALEHVKARATRLCTEHEGAMSSVLEGLTVRASRAFEEVLAIGLEIHALADHDEETVRAGEITDEMIQQLMQGGAEGTPTESSDTGEPFGLF